MTKKILVINPFGIGDVLFSTPLLKAIKNKFPDVVIAYVCNKRTAGILKNDPNISTLYIFEKDEYRELWENSRIKCLKKARSFIKRIAEDRYDVLIDLSLGYIYSLALAIFASIPMRIGFNYRNRGRFLTHKIDIEGFGSKHVVEYYLNTLKPLGMNLTTEQVALQAYVSDIDAKWADDFLMNNGIDKKDLSIGIIPGCGMSWGEDAKFRRWAKENFAAVADETMDRYGAKVILFGNSKETEICDDVRRMMKNKAVSSCGKTSVGQALGLLNRCALVITNDGGPLHMAVALGIKTVSIFGPVDEKVYGPYPSNSGHHIALSNKAVSCRPCYKKFKFNRCDNSNCLKGITTKDVMQAVDSLLAGQRKKDGQMQNMR